MAYFSNGTECDMYEDKYCEKCITWRKRQGDFGAGCPVWDIHFADSYEECNSKSKAKVILDRLIPMSKDGLYAEECAMFMEKEGGS